MTLAISGRPANRRRINTSRRIDDHLRRTAGIQLGTPVPADPVGADAR
jgi:hypothetical protein